MEEGVISGGGVCACVWWAGLQNFQNFMSAGISMENFISNFSNLFRPYPPIKCKTHQIWPTFSWKPCFFNIFFLFFQKKNSFSCLESKFGMFDWTHFQRKLMITGNSYKLINEMKFFQSNFISFCLVGIQWGKSICLIGGISKGN